MIKTEIRTLGKYTFRGGGENRKGVTNTGRKVEVQAQNSFQSEILFIKKLLDVQKPTRSILEISS